MDSQLDNDVRRVEWKNFGETLANDLFQFFDSGDYSDVSLFTEDGYEIKSHRILLAMCSGYFHDLFRRNKVSSQCGKLYALTKLQGYVQRTQ